MTRALTVELKVSVINSQPLEQFSDGEGASHGQLYLGLSGEFW